MINQKFYSRGQDISIASEFYLHNEQELVLDKSDIKILNGAIKVNNSNKQVINLFNHILEQVNQYFPVYDIYKSREVLNSSKEIFENLTWNDQWRNRKLINVGQKTILNRILIGLHANAARIKISELGFKNDFGLLTQTSGITFTPDTQIIYQSPTGLFERRVALRDL